MKATLKINDKEIEVDITEEELKKLEEKKPRKRWRAEEGQEYWYVSNDGEIAGVSEVNDIYDDYVYSVGNYFKTQEEAEFHKNELIYTQMLKDYIYEHDDVELDWVFGKVMQARCCLVYNCNTKEIEYYGGCTFKFQGAIYASNEQVLKDAVGFIGEENVKKYILKVQE